MDKEEIRDTLESITSVPRYEDAIKSIVKATLDNMVKSILTATITTQAGQDKMVLDKARYEGANQALTTLLDELGKVLKNGERSSV